MIALAVALVSVAAFAAALAATSIGPLGRAVVATAMEGVGTILDRDLGEDEKEARVRRAGGRLLLQAFGIAWRFAAALTAAAVPVLAAEALGIVPGGETLALMLDPYFIVAVSVGLILLVAIAGRRAPASGTDGVTAYSPTDRFYHMLAFASPGLMKGLAQLDERVARRRMAGREIGPPVFVTSLARGGTTALLNALAGEPSLGSYTYRDMPFVTAPVLWSRLSGGKREVARQQRAHGDGLEIGLDSPEALDEVLWMLGWPEKYRADRILPWDEADFDAEAVGRLDAAFARIAWLRRHDDGAARLRYLSKNNANIARIGLLKRAFPGCHVVIALRHPEAHALSLMRQHENFLKRHAEDPFALRYMRDIGHFEFGALHRPLAFPGVAPGDTASPDYWLAYWIAAFREVARQRGECLIVEQDRLRADPEGTMRRLLEALGVTQAQTDFGGYFRGGPDNFPQGRFSPALAEEARTLYADLTQDAL